MSPEEMLKLRAKGTPGEWRQRGHGVFVANAPDNAALIVAAVNNVDRAAAIEIAARVIIGVWDRGQNDDAEPLLEALGEFIDVALRRALEEGR